MATVAQIIITHVKSVTVGGDAIEGIKNASINISQTVKEGTSDGAPGITSQDKTNNEITVTLQAESHAAILAVIAHAVGNVVITGRKSGLATNRVTTIKNVKFRSSSFNYPAANAQELGQTTNLVGKANWASTDTLATMITET